MEKYTECTAFEAAAMWDLHRSKPEDYTGLILVVDLDRANAGICRCESGRLPRQQWCSQSGVSQDYFLTLVRDRFACCANESALANMLYGGISNTQWVRAQKGYLRSGKTMDLPLPAVVIDGKPVNLTCAGLDEIYGWHWADATRKVLEEAKAQLAGEPARILPVGRLARVFLAEYLIRETFLDIPLVDDPRLRLWAPDEDPAAAVSKGMELYQSAISKSQLLEHTVMVQTQRRQNDQLKPALLTLAKKGTSYEQLKQISYTDKIYVGSDKSLTLYADSQSLSIALPSGSGNILALGLGVVQQKLMLFIRDGSRIGKIPLDLT